MTCAGELIDPGSDRWRWALQRCWHQVYQLPEYVTFDARLNDGQPTAFIYQEGQDIFLLPFVVRQIPGTDRSDAISPYGYPGPVCNCSEPEFWTRAAAALGRTLRDAKLVSLFVRLDPLQPKSCQALSDIGTLVTHGATVSIDLQLPREQWWSQVRKDHREAINRSRRLGRTSTMDEWSYLETFVSMYHETMARVGASPEYRFDLAYFQRLHSMLNDRVHLLVVFADDEPIAGSLLLTTGGIMQAHLTGTRTTFQRTEKSPRFLVYEAVRWGGDNGYSTFQLGGGVGGREDSVFYFKQGFSPRRHPFQTLRVISDPSAYFDLVGSTDPLAEDVTGFFPLYRARAA